MTQEIDALREHCREHGIGLPDVARPKDSSSSEALAFLEEGGTSARNSFALSAAPVGEDEGTASVLLSDLNVSTFAHIEVHDELRVTESPRIGPGLARGNNALGPNGPTVAAWNHSPKSSEKNEHIIVRKNNIVFKYF